MTARAIRLIGLAGLIFLILILLSIFIIPTPPDTDTHNTAKVIAYYHKHKTGVQAETIITGIGVLFGLPFYWYLREAIVAAAPTVKTVRLATLGFVASMLFLVTGAVTMALDWALAEAVDHVDGSSLQTLNTLAQDPTQVMGWPFVTMFFLATGFALLGARALLPVWVAWLTIVFGVISVVIGEYVSLPLMGIWVLIASITLIVRAGKASSTAAVSSDRDPATNVVVTPT